ncbi:AAC(3)-VI family aminoglycoside N-acetyltransferase [Rhodobacteraceae bacterium 2CG4]|uniref:Aminoglycoside N(3)-acetyltransferase n=1 Tax=Halovulum marinum TaxID=2662447 RepID=A0A6L5Z6R4_9RHOB|nr:AAC(3) family N-acetyltransferase [Halovulum marinum]MSU92243.1 AAC(3)-VI family aminoglycoside N-acetyltransferase [Halovulum marinum]
MHGAGAETSIRELTAQLRALGVTPGDTLLVHASFRAVRPVARGPDGVIDALLTALGEDGTLLMPSWTGDDDVPFDAATTPAAQDLGVIADRFWRRIGVLRARHPMAFAAHGPAAIRLLRDRLVLPPHQMASPVGRLLQAEGKVLLLGVDHDANTLLHLAEWIAGVPYGVPHHVTLRDAAGQPMRRTYREPDHCCQLFRQAGNWLRAQGLQGNGRVGRAEARLFRAADLIEVALPRLRRDPFVFVHRADCAECQAARDSVARMQG